MTPHPDAYQIISAQMRIALQHPKFLVTADAAYFHDVQATLEQPADSFVPEIMEPKFADLVGAALVLRDGVLFGLSHRAKRNSVSFSKSGLTGPE